MLKRIFCIIEHVYSSILIIVSLVLCIIYQFNAFSYLLFTYFVMGSGLINLIIMTLKQWKIKDYTVKRFTPVIYVVQLLAGVLGFYLITYVGYYENMIYAYWFILIALIIIPIIVFNILSKYLKVEAPKGIARNVGRK